MYWPLFVNSGVVFQRIERLSVELEANATQSKQIFLFFDRHGAQNSSKHAFANDTAHPAYPLCCMYKIIRVCLFLRINRKTSPRR